MLALADSGENIHLTKQATTTMVPVIISNDMTERLVYGSTLDQSHIATIQLPGISKQAIQIHTCSKMKEAALTSLGVFCDDGYTITIYKHDISVQNNVQKIIKGIRNNQTGMWELLWRHINRKLWQIKFWPRQKNHNSHSNFMQHFPVQKQQASLRQSNKVY